MGTFSYKIRGKKSLLILHPQKLFDELHFVKDTAFNVPHDILTARYSSEVQSIRTEIVCELKAIAKERHSSLPGYMFIGEHRFQNTLAEFLCGSHFGNARKDRRC